MILYDGIWSSLLRYRLKMPIAGKCRRHNRSEREKKGYFLRNKLWKKALKQKQKEKIDSETSNSNWPELIYWIHYNSQPRVRFAYSSVLWCFDCISIKYTAAVNRRTDFQFGMNFIVKTTSCKLQSSIYR